MWVLPALQRVFGKGVHVQFNESGILEMYGWSVPAALQLWPHKGDFRTIKGIKGLHAYKAPQFQPWPTYKPPEHYQKWLEVKEDTTKKGKNKSYYALEGFAGLFTTKPPREDQRQLFALGMTYEEYGSALEYAEKASLDEPEPPSEPEQPSEPEPSSEPELPSEPQPTQPAPAQSLNLPEVQQLQDKPALVSGR